MLLDNNGDATSIAAGATHFTMNTGLNYGADYSITVGSQPYGIALACRVTNGTGSVSGAVNTVAVTCAPTTATQKVIARYLNTWRGSTVDANGDLLIAEGYSSLTGYLISKLSYSNGAYGPPVPIASLGTLGPTGINLPPPPPTSLAFAIAQDGAGNLFVANGLDGDIEKISFDGSSYGRPDGHRIEF